VGGNGRSQKEVRAKSNRTNSHRYGKTERSKPHKLPIHGDFTAGTTVGSPGEINPGESEPAGRNRKSDAELAPLRNPKDGSFGGRGSGAEHSPRIPEQSGLHTLLHEVDCGKAGAGRRRHDVVARPGLVTLDKKT
jgi:hypothetical protein